MVLDKLGDSLKGTLKKVTQSVFVDDELINELVQDIQRALLEADVNVELVSELTDTIKERALDEETPSGITEKEHLVNIVYEELTEFLGGEGKPITLEENKTNKIMLTGLFGAGKTTTAGKLAKYYKTRGYNIALIQTDTWRPAAYEQLKQLSERVEVDFYGKKEADNPTQIYKEYEDELSQYDLVIVDTAGRDALTSELFEELNQLDNKVQADEKLLVLSADIGQSAREQATAFNEAVNITGVVATKLDGTAKAGGALTACAQTNSNVTFIGTGETTDDLELFRPERFVSRLLGMGDLETLLEKAERAMEEEKAEDLGKKFMEGDFNLMDLHEQLQAMNQMGSLSKIMEMVPGMGQLELPDEALDVQEEKMEIWKYVMNSMTEEELKDPDIINRSRKERIATGAGVDKEEINQLINQYDQAKEMSKMMQGRDMKKMMKKMTDGNLDPSKFGF